MLDALKDLYIYHPFLPVSDPPAWFEHVKDVRCVVTLPASNIISQYKNSNCVRAWLRREVAEDSLDGYRIVAKVLCSQVLLTTVNVELPVCNLEVGAPSTQTYMLVDSGFNATDIPMNTDFELQPDVLVFMQQAPVLYIDSEELPVDARFTNGHNISVSKIQNGVLLFGAAGVGLGVYREDPLGALGEHQQGLGARSINGLEDAVYIQGSYPVAVEVRGTTSGDLTMSVSVE